LIEEILDIYNKD